MLHESMMVPCDEAEAGAELQDALHAVYVLGPGSPCSPAYTTVEWNFDQQTSRACAE